MARNLPGDERSIEWASPWAGASFIFGGTSIRREMKMQLDAFAELLRWSTAYPESSIKRITLNDIFDEEKTETEIWWKDYVPDVRKSNFCCALSMLEDDLLIIRPPVSFLEEGGIAEECKIGNFL